jgi:hypothetical protein
MMITNNISRVNNENDESQELERLKEKIRKMTNKDYEFTDEKASKYLTQKDGNAKLDARVKGLV